MRWGWTQGIGSLGGLAALSACMPMYDQAGYAPPPPPAAYSDQESPDDYRWIDRADALWDAIGNAPPDHAFAFDGAEPWAWVTGDGYTIIVEDGPGGIRSYYFEPGARSPFLAVEPGMSFGYEGAAVGVVYGPDSSVLPRGEGAAYLGRAMELYARGQRLLAAMTPQAFTMVDSTAWIDASVYITLFRQDWSEGRNRHPGWRRHREESGIWLGRFAQERLRRAGQAEAFRRWREGGFQGPPPGRFRRPGESRPGIGRPHQPGQGWHRGGPPRQPERPWTGPPRGERPAMPGRPRKVLEGAEPPVPVDAVPSPVTRPPRPDRPGWGGRWPRPGAPAQPGAAPPPADPPADAVPGARPPRPDRPGWGGRWPRPGAAVQPGAAPAPRPDGAGSTDRPRWSRPEGMRPGWSRPPAAADPAPAARPAWRAPPESGRAQPGRGFGPAPAPVPRAAPPAPPPRSEPRQPPPPSPARAKREGMNPTERPE